MKAPGFHHKERAAKAWVYGMENAGGETSYKAGNGQKFHVSMTDIIFFLSKLLVVSKIYISVDTNFFIIFFYSKCIQYIDDHKLKTFQLLIILLT